MHVNIVNWNSLDPKKAYLSTFLGQLLHFLSEMQKKNITTYTIGKLGPSLFLSLLKKWCNTFSNAVAVKCTLYLARPLKEPSWRGTAVL